MNNNSKDKENQPIPDYIIADTINKCLRVMPENVTPLGIISIARTIEKEYFQEYLGLYPNQIDEVIKAETMAHNQFMATLKDISDQYFKQFKEKNR